MYLKTNFNPFINLFKTYSSDVKIFTNLDNISTTELVVEIIKVNTIFNITYITDKKYCYFSTQDYITTFTNLTKKWYCNDIQLNTSLVYRVTTRAVILDNDSIVLLNIHLNKQDLYESAGGGLYPHHDPIKNLKKEVKEETGIIIKNINYLTTIVENTTLSKNQYINYQKTTSHIYYTCQIKQYQTKKLLSSEIDIIKGYQIIKKNEVIDLLTNISPNCPNNKNIIQRELQIFKLLFHTTL